jgi:hypothetical protein
MYGCGNGGAAGPACQNVLPGIPGKGSLKFGGTSACRARFVKAQGCRRKIRATFMMSEKHQWHHEDSNMATTIAYGKKLPDFDNFSQFDGTTLAVSKLTDDTFTMKDKDGTSMVFEGEDFEKTQSVITGGTITSAEFYNSAGKRIYTFDGLEVDAADLYKVFALKSDPIRIIHGLMDGDDTVTGSKKKDSMWGFGGDDELDGKAGDDWLYGHRGNDTLTGGAGADHFAFLVGYDSDTVIDFDLTGKDQDFIYMDYYLYKSMTYTEDGGNLILELSTGDTLTLIGLEQADIEGKTKFFDFF